MTIRCFVLVTLECALNVHIGSGSYTMGTAMLHGHIYTVEQNGQTALEKMSF